jgi:two-component system OmpR family sensor kinase
MSPLLSLRVRLTFSYTLTCALALALVVLVTSRLAFGILMHPLIEAVQQSADAARRVIAAHPDASLVVLEKAIVRAASRPDVSIIVIPNNGIHTAAPRQDVFKSLPESASRLGFQRVLISARDGTVFIAPDFRRVNPMIQGYITYVAASLLGAVLAAWLIARWITTQALNPLVLVTSELERFGNGDFSTRPVATGFDRSELGRLTTAYNAAASQVSAAFEERERVAHEMRTLLGDAGHALRTPLTVVTGFIDVLDGASFDDPRVRERAIRSMRIETRRMRLLVEGLMSLARMEQTENRSPTRVNVGAAAEIAIEQVRATRGGDVTLRRSSGAVVLADPAEVHEAVVNLVENAVKYGAGTPVSVDVTRDNGIVVVRVGDHGPGIPESDHARIFERFFRGEHRPTIDGSGLGLAIVARAIGRCGGSVQLERADPGDTSFSLRMPAADPAP